MRLEDKVAIVTGGNSGIGRATAHRFAEEGAAVVVAGRNQARNDEVVSVIRQQGGRSVGVRVDVRNEDECKKAIETAVTEFGGLDILFNNAGIIYREKTAPNTTLEEWSETMGVSATGTFLMSKHAIGVMALSGGGSIVNNASYFGIVGGKGAAAYCAAKGAVVLLTKAMALDHAADRIRVNCVAAGSVDTPMLRGEMEEMGGAEAVRHLFESKHPLGRIASPDEIAHAVVYLASDEASFVTGITLPVDGGITAG